MSKFYAKFKETDDEIIVFKTQQERDDWVNFKDEFSVLAGCTKENSTLEREPLTKKEATYLIKSRDLSVSYDKDFIGNIRELYVPRSPACMTRKSIENKETKERNKMQSNTTQKINRKISLTPEYGIVERKPMAALVMQNAVSVGTKKFAWIDVALLNIPPYQRARRNHVYKIAEEWDSRKCDVIRVSYDENNNCFNVVDGQHRAAAAKMCGERYLVCEIETGMNISSEAKLFVEFNVGRKKLNPFDEYKANQFISEEDDTELSKLDKRIAKVCDDYNVEVRQSAGCGTLKTIPHARKIIKREGEPGLEFIFEVIQDSHWDKFPNGYSYVVMEAFRKIYDTHSNNLDSVKKKLISELSKSSPREIEALGNRKYPNLGRTARWDAVMAQIIA